MFNLRTNLNRRKTRYNVYQPQRYTLYVLGKWLGLISSALLLFGLTIKWLFLLSDHTWSLFNILTWCLIIGSIVLFTIGAIFIVGLHYYVEKKYNSTVKEDDNEIEKTQKNLREEHRNQSKRYKQPDKGWLKWKKQSSKLPLDRNVDVASSVTNSIKPNSTTIYNTNATESSFQVLSNDSFSDTTSNATSTSFSSTKKLVRTNSKFNQPSLPIIDETKQQSANDNYAGIQVSYIADTTTPKQPDVIFDAKQLDCNPTSNINKSNKTKHVHKLSSGSGKNYILETFLKQDLTEGATIDQPNNQVLNQNSSSSSNTISSPNNLTNANGALNNALDLTE